MLKFYPAFCSCSAACSPDSGSILISRNTMSGTLIFAKRIHSLPLVKLSTSASGITFSMIAASPSAARGSSSSTNIFATSVCSLSLLLYTYLILYDRSSLCIQSDSDFMRCQLSSISLFSPFFPIKYPTSFTFSKISSVRSADVINGSGD